MSRTLAFLARAASLPALALLFVGSSAAQPPAPASQPVDDREAATSAPLIEATVAEAVAGGAAVRVHVVFKGARPLPPRATHAQEEALLNEVAAAHRSFRASMHAQGFRILHEHAWTHGIVAEIDDRGLEALTRNPRVAYVYLDGEVHASLAQGVPLIGADAVQASGANGAGITIAIVDTGVDYNHSALGGCFGGSCKVAGGFDYVNNDSNPIDDNGHGTAVAGVAASNGTGASLGVAPGARLAALKVLAASGSGTFAAVDNALNWVLTNRVALGIRVVNMSLGDGGQYGSSGLALCNTSSTANLIESLANAGVAVAIASGNEGYDAGVSFPACVAEATSVGGVYDANVGSVSWCGNSGCTTILCTDNPTFADKFVCHSNAGLTLDVLAPDWRTTTTRLGGGTTDFGGTSAASPYVAGAYALIFDIMPSATVASVEANFKSTGHLVTNPGNGQSYPRIDVAAAAMGFDADLDGEPDSTDNCPAVYNPGQEDGDLDGHGDVCDNCPAVYNNTQADADSDPSGDACDCNSANGAVYHGAPEVCDGVNNNCSDPNWPSLAPEIDNDLDGMAECGGDCDDANPARFAGNPEACDGIDNDCNGSVPITENDADGDGVRICGGDCDDANPARFPGNPEICDGVDNDCSAGVPSGELDTDADGFRPCNGDCDDSSPARFPGNPEICDGLDNNCDSVVPGGEFDLDLDGSMICEGDCQDSDGAIFPGAAEICDGRNNNCLHPAWPSLSVESDDDGDGLAECAGDCDDTTIAVFPGHAEVCDELDNDCDGRTDPGYPFMIEGNPLPTITQPGAALADRFGGAILSLADVDLDGTPDFAAGSPGSPSGTSTLGAIRIFSGDDRSSIRVLTDPNGTTPAELGTAMASPGDVDADGVPEIAGSAPTQTAQGPSFEQGRVIMFSGATGSVLWSYQKTTAASQARLGTSIAAIADVNGNGVREIVAGMIIGCQSGPDCGGTATILDGLTGAAIRTLWDTTGLAGDRFGSSMASLGDQDADGDDELAIGSPSKAVSGTGGAGQVRLYSTGNGVLLRAISDPDPDPNDGLGEAIAAIADLDGDGKLDLLAGSPGRDTGAGPDAGQILVFSGATGALIRRLEDPAGAAGDRFGSAVAAIPDLNGDGTAEIAAGVRNADTIAGADAGKVVVFSGFDGAHLAILVHPSPGVSDHFGTFVAAVGPVDGDGRAEIAAGAPEDNGVAADTGSLVLFSAFSIGDCDGDSIGNPVDTCTDADLDGFGTDIFLPQACPVDCDDSNGNTYPGGAQICDGANNDCGDPSYPVVSPNECFQVLNLTAQRAGANLLLQWAVPSGGADLYRVYRALGADLQAGTSGGFCFATSVPASIQLSDPAPFGTITYYLVAGVRGSLEGSRGNMFPVQERPRGDICP